MLSAWSALSCSGVMRLLPDGPPSNLQPATLKAHRAYLPTSLGSALRELKAIPSTLEVAGQYRQLADRPLVVLTAMAPSPEAVLNSARMTRDQDDRRRVAWKALHEEEATWSTHSRHELVPDATHYIQFDRPDIVIRAVREVVGAVRNGSPADTTESRPVSIR